MVELFGDVIGKLICGFCGKKVYSHHKKCPRCGKLFSHKIQMVNSGN